MSSPTLEQLAGHVRSAARVVAKAPSSVRDDTLRLAADLLEQEWAPLVEANRADLDRAEAAGMVEAARDRLRLTEEHVRAMAAGVRNVASLPDPVGEITEGWVRPNGLRVTRVRVPLGVVGVIYGTGPMSRVTRPRSASRPETLPSSVARPRPSSPTAPSSPCSRGGGEGRPA